MRDYSTKVPDLQERHLQFMIKEHLDAINFSRNLYLSLPMTTSVVKGDPPGQITQQHDLWHSWR